MNKLLAFFLIIFLNFSPINAEIVKKIEIDGNKRISDETIKVYGDIKNLDRNFTKQDLDKILKNLYDTNFFENVNLRIKNNTLIVNLKEYPLINTLVLLGEKTTKFKEQIIKIIKTKENGSFIESVLKEDINTIKNLYSSIGYNFSEIIPKIRKIDDSNVDLVININKGGISKISKISFTGDKKIKDKRLRDIIASQEDKFWKIISKNTKFSENLINLDKRLLQNYYKSIGYYDVTIDSASANILDTEQIELTYTINAGQRYTIDKITTTVDEVFDKKIFFPLEKIYKKNVGAYYSPFKVKKILEEIDQIIDKNNLQFVEHRVNETISDDKISLAFEIFEGEKVLVERINVIGNNITNESVIRSELLLDEGDPFTELKLEKSIAKIMSRNIFGKVDHVLKDGSTRDLKVIDIIVSEKPTGEISAGAGIGTDGGSFAINIQENNWLGEGKKVGFDIEVDQDSLKGEINYVNPNYDLLGNSLTYRLYNNTNDKPDQGFENTLTGFSVGTAFEQYKNIYTNLALNLSYDDLKTTSNASSSLKKQKGQFAEISGRYGFTLDERDRAFMPTDGTIMSFFQTLPFYADKPFLENRITSSSYHSFSENFVGAGKLYIDTIHGLNDEDVRISKRKFLGLKRLRGFEKGKIGPVDGLDHVGGNYSAAVNFEGSLPNLLPDSYNAELGVFLDFGNVWGVDYDKSLDESNKLRSSTGFAVNWISPLGPISFVFAQNLSKASTDETQTFNFNLGTSF
tara:strand:- start:1580 stop:3814 length:2235 start_codon:yes stop_codon:yes gene_type:complete